MSQYAARYRAARAYAGLSQEDLAEKLGVDSQTIKRRESGKQEPKKAELIAVAAICEVPLQFMQDGWGVLRADEIGPQLADQAAVIARIESMLLGETPSYLVIGDVLKSHLDGIEKALKRETRAASRGARLLDQAAEHIERVLPVVPQEQEPARKERAKSGTQQG